MIPQQEIEFCAKLFVIISNPTFSRLTNYVPEALQNRFKRPIQTERTQRTSDRRVHARRDSSLILPPPHHPDPKRSSSALLASLRCSTANLHIIHYSFTLSAPLCSGPPIPPGLGGEDPSTISRLMQSITLLYKQAGTESWTLCRF